jgi:hypothetical protein
MIVAHLKTLKIKLLQALSLLSSRKLSYSNYIVPFLAFMLISMSPGLTKKSSEKNKRTAFINKRTAIIFGMSSYQTVDQLPLCKNDADSIAEVLTKLNFDVKCYKDLSKLDMENAISQWASTLNNYEVGLFYYSGHGAEIAGENYLFPVDARVYSTPSQTKNGTVGLSEVLGVFDDVTSTTGSKLKANLIILDACRDNPFTKSWSKSLSTKGLANIDISSIPNGTFIGYASSPGKTASAIGVTNSPYTKGILKNIFNYESIDDVFTDVNSTVRLLTGNEQTPWKTSNFDQKFYFAQPETKTKSLHESVVENSSLSTSADRIKDFAQVIKFGSSIDDVIVGEYGPTFNGSVKYQDLPVAIECKNKLIKYYWRKISQSKYSKGILTYLNAYGLSSQITDDSYITYMFSDNKLVLISIRLFFNQIEFHKKLAESFQIDLNKYPTKFFYDTGEYYAFFSLEQNMDVTTIDIGDKNTQDYCTLNWYGGPKF